MAISIGPSHLIAPSLALNEEERIKAQGSNPVYCINIIISVVVIPIQLDLKAYIIMGAEQSKINGGETRYGFNVLRIDENSPAHTAGLIPLFDYIVAVNGVEIVISVFTEGF